MSREVSPTKLDVPDFSLVVLIGATGSGKSTFARKHFKPTEIISSDYARGLVSDDENDQAASADAFELVRFIAEKRLKNRKIAVIDATNVRASERKQWVEIARRWHALPVAIVLDPGLDVCVERNKARPDRNFGPGVPQRMISEIRRGLRGLQREGFRQVWTLSSADAIEAADVDRRPLWTDRRDDAGPFDIIGDVHGCAEELERLIQQLGYELEWDQDGPSRSARIHAPHGRKLVFVGDLVDRGPRSPDAVRIAMAAIEAGGYVVQGNHDNKLQRWMDGRKVTIAHGLQESIDQLAVESEAFQTEMKAFLYDLRSHYWLDSGRLAVAHAGLREEMIGRGSASVRDFALYGETTGEIDEFGLPVRRIGRPTTAVSVPLSTATLPSLKLSGSTTRSASTRDACSAASCRPCAGRSESWSKFRQYIDTASRCAPCRPPHCLRMRKAPPMSSSIMLMFQGDDGSIRRC